MHWNRILLGTLFLTLMGGCSDTRFVYKPSAPVAGGPKLPAKIAVFPFADGTENITKRVYSPSIVQFNLAKAGISGWTDALAPELWSKAFADELAASGRFESVRFLYDRSELADEEYLVEGTLGKALHSGNHLAAHEFALSLRAMRRAGNGSMWEKTVSRTWQDSPDFYDPCSVFSQQCLVDLDHAGINRAMQEMFADAGADLAATLTTLAGGEAGAGAKFPDGPPAVPAPGSVDETIENILKGK